MVRGLPADREVADPIYFLNKWAALYADQRPQDDEKPDVKPSTHKGLRVRLGITNHRKLQGLGCGFRVVTVQFRGKTVVLHHNGNTATIAGRLEQAISGTECRMSGPAAAFLGKSERRGGRA